MAAKYLCRCRLEAVKPSSSVLFTASWVTIFVATSMLATAELPGPECRLVIGAPCQVRPVLASRTGSRFSNSNGAVHGGAPSGRGG